MSKSIAVGLLIAFNAPFSVWGQQPTDADPSPERIVAVDADLVARAVSSDAVPMLGGSRFAHFGVARKYHDAGGMEFELVVGIYPTASLAARALMRTTPQSGRKSPQPLGDEHFFSRRGVHMRLNNIAVLLRFDDVLAEEERVALAVGLDAALRDSAIVTFGNSVNTPEIDVVGFEGQRVIYRISDGDAFFAQHSTRVLEDGRHETRVRKGFYDSEPTLRLTRATGEVLELPLSEIPDALRLPPETRTPKLSAQQRSEIIGEIRAGKSTPSELSVLMHELRQDADPELVPFFVEIMASEHPVFVKKFALRGLATVEGKKRLEAYAEYATDHNQPELIRRDAIRLIGRFGAKEDVQVLMPILDEKSDVLTRAVEDAILVLESR